MPLSSSPEKKLSRREQRKKNWQTIKRNIPAAIDLMKPYRRLWLFGLLMLLISKAAGLVLPGTPKILIDHVLPEQSMAALNWLIGAVLAATMVQGLATFALTQTISKAGQRLIAELRVRVHNHISRLALRYFDNHKSGEIVSRVMNDAEGVRNLVGTGMIEFAGGIVTAVFGFAILLYLNWQLTLVLLIFILLFVAILIKAFTVLAPIFRKRQEVVAGVSGRLTESISGVRVVKAYTAEETERRVFAKGVDAILTQLLRTINAISYVALSSAVLLGALGAAILFIGGRQLLDGEMTSGEFISYLLYLGFMIAPISSIMMIGTQFSEAFAGIERINEVLEVSPEEHEKDKAEMPPIKGEVEFRNVAFAYDEGKPVLHDVSFSAAPGTVTALVGPSGSGKSTLMSLIAAFYHPQSGAVCIDNIDISGVRLYDYRNQLGVVLQENFLFDGTVRENLLYVRPEATENQVREAAGAAHCLEFVEAFPDGFDTLIGERGVKLSGGQRQRLAIARALLADPRLLLLDEATSALDSESEAYIQEALGRLMEGRTTFVIAHRLSTIRHADQILVLDGGRLVERGTHQELLARKGKYFDMYTRQHGLEETLFVDEQAKEEAESVEEKDVRKERMARLSKLLSGE